ncbi:L,D-transpeptidase family protein [Inhella proteolytica]|uniref:L,D-transpeptidase family protein n=1 Tax=Inhella proteolytica TaxID=2795029 RepID=A0A931NFZ2_9BURK|nr:L,D-transpeptidase family protein [Inhella proteolytica]MBH9576153.1 L,D-transpeptidase family protein [Inhella proteolytica]
MLLLALISSLLLLLQRSDDGQAWLGFAWAKLRGGYTVEERLAQHGAAVEARLRTQVEAAGLTYPPAHLALVAIKDEALLLVYGRSETSATWQPLLSYPIRGMSGRQGPKLRRGDFQVPEGIYRVESLNANSRFHLSLRLDYPNAFDQTRAQADGRNDLGSDIMIHGTRSSIGCLAMGNQAAEDLFVLAALARPRPVEVLITPTDWRRQQPMLRAGPAWLHELDRELQRGLARFPRALGAG